jgi:Na+/H+ antiporter NhaD/arsenite permease-like protein
MYEVFPVVAGIIIGVLVPRFVSSAQQRRWVYAFLGIAVAALATIIAGEEWFFIFIDLAEVFLAIGVTVYVVDYLSRRKTTPIQ